MTKGIENLGNTCYMNAALQVLANTPYFKQYFVGYFDPLNQEERIPYKYQINMTNPLGHKGEFVEQFAGVMKKVWNSKKQVDPSIFRQYIAKANS